MSAKELISTLEAQFNTMGKLVMKRIDDNDFIFLKKVLQSYYYHLYNNNLKVIASVSVPMCDFCYNPYDSKNEKPLILGCNHKICSEKCFKELLIQFTNDDILDFNEILCPARACGFIIDKKIVSALFGGEENYSEIKENLIKNSKKHFKCVCCNKLGKVIQATSFDCFHKCCETCLVDLKKDLVDGNNLNCPECDEPVSDAIFIKMMSAEEQELLSQKLIQSMKDIVKIQSDEDSEEN